MINKFKGLTQTPIGSSLVASIIFALIAGALNYFIPELSFKIFEKKIEISVLFLVSIVVFWIAVIIIHTWLQTLKQNNSFSDFYKRLNSSRLSIAISYDVNNRMPDICHKYLNIERHDFFFKGKFISFRTLKFKNMSKSMTNYIIQTESIENKLLTEDVTIKAFNKDTKQELRVEKSNSTKKEFYHDFSIYFIEALAPKGILEISYYIVVDEKINSFEYESELDGICLNRYRKGVDKLDFKISLLSKPKSYYLKSMDRFGNVNLLKNKLNLIDYSLRDEEIEILKEYVSEKSFPTLTASIDNVEHPLILITYES